MKSWCCKHCLNEALPFHNTSFLEKTDDPSSTQIYESLPISVPTSTLSHLSIYYANCRSLLPKLDHLRTLAANQNYHILSLCETWLDSTISNDEMYVPGYSILRRDRDRHGGGIAIYIHENCEFTLRLSHPDIELLLLDIQVRRFAPFLQTPLLWHSGP